MKHIRITLMMTIAAILFGCGTSSTVPITGRQRTLMVSDEQVLSLANDQYKQYMQTAKPSTNAANTAMVKRVGQRLANAVVSYLKNNGLANEVAQYQWEFNLVQDQQANAFCMPGGKIVVYEGLLPVTQNENALAIVLGHEIAHAVAKHSAEQMSTAIKQQYGAQALGALMAGASIHANMRARQTIWASSSLLWLAMILRLLSASGSACRKLLVAALLRGSALTPVMLPVSSRFRDGCPRP